MKGIQIYGTLLLYACAFLPSTNDTPKDDDGVACSVCMKTHCHSLSLLPSIFLLSPFARLHQTYPKRSLNQWDLNVCNTQSHQKKRNETKLNENIERTTDANAHWFCVCLCIYLFFSFARERIREIQKQTHVDAMQKCLLLILFVHNNKILAFSIKLSSIWYFVKYQ